MIEFLKLGEYSFFPFIINNLHIVDVKNINVNYGVPPDPITDSMLLIPASQSNVRYIYKIICIPENGVLDNRWLSNVAYKGIFAFIFITDQTAVQGSLYDLYSRSILLPLEPYELEQTLNPDGGSNYYYKTSVPKEVIIRLKYNQNVFIIPIWPGDDDAKEPFVRVNIIKYELPELNIYTNKLLDITKTIGRKIYSINKIPIRGVTK